MILVTYILIYIHIKKKLAENKGQKSIKIPFDTSVKGTSINDVTQFQAIFDLPTYPNHLFY